MNSLKNPTGLPIWFAVKSG